MRNRISKMIRRSWRQLGPLELRMLETLWRMSSATVRELYEGQHKELAYTTLMTTLDRLFKKGLLVRSLEKGAFHKHFRYSPRFSRDELIKDAAGNAFRQLLDLSSVPILPLSFLVDIVSELDIQSVDTFWQIVEHKRRERGRHGPARGRGGKA